MELKEQFREENGRLVSGPELVSVRTKEHSTVPARTVVTVLLGLLLFVAGSLVGRALSPDPAPQLTLKQQSVALMRNGCIPTAFVTGVGKESELGDLTRATAAQETELKLLLQDEKNVQAHVYTVPVGSKVDGAYLGIITFERCLP